MTSPLQRKPIYRDFVLLQLAALILILDQGTKILVRELLVLRESFPTEGFFRITHTFNTGSAFGIFRDQNTPLIVVSFVGIAILILIYRSQAAPTNLLRLSLGLQLGGAVGNLIDRLAIGHVTDFVDVGAWPIFNVADASIVSGLVLLAWIFLVAERDQGRQTLPAYGAGMYDSCPVCSGDIRAIPGGWHCTTCGVKERIDLGSREALLANKTEPVAEVTVPLRDALIRQLLRPLGRLFPSRKDKQERGAVGDIPD